MYRLVTGAASRRTVGGMVALAGILLLIGLGLLLVGIFVEAAKFLLWLGLVIIVVAIIVGLMRFIRRQV